MPLSLHWFLPTAGDSRDVVGFGPTAGRRSPSLDYLAQVARAAEAVGFDAVLTPTGTHCEDAWIATAALLPETTTLRFLVAFRPGLVSPTLAAQQARTFQRLSGGRLLLNVVTGGNGEEQKRFGDFLDHDERYDRTAEFIEVLRGAWSGGFDYAGRHYTVEGATVAGAPFPAPPIFFGGSSTAGKIVAARHADTWLMWGEPPADAAEQLAEVRGLAAEAGRPLSFGIRLHVISRDTADEAWAVTDRLLDAMPQEVVDRAQTNLTYSESVGQQRMAALHGGRRDDLVVAPNLWAGFGLVRGGAGTALVGSHDEVAARITEYHQLGFDHFILSGQPHLEEAYHFGEGVIPRLRSAGLLATAPARSATRSRPERPRTEVAMTAIQIAPDPGSLTAAGPPALRAIVVNGSPSTGSRTATVARVAADALPDATTIHLCDLSAEALLGRTVDAAVDEALGAIRGAEVLVVATPIYRATYTALTKSIFDLLPQGALEGSVVVPVATGATNEHALAVDHGLRPLFASLGAWTTPAGVFACHADFDDDGLPLARLVDAIEHAIDQATRFVQARKEIP